LLDLIGMTEVMPFYKTFSEGFFIKLTVFENQELP